MGGMLGLTCFVVIFLQALLSHGADLDSKNEEEQTPVHLAAKFGRTK